MRKTIYFILLLLQTVVVFPQKESTARLSYEVRMKKHKSELSLTQKQKFYNEFVKKAGENMFYLDIKDSLSIFYSIDKMKSDSKKKINLISTILGNEISYYNYNNNESLTKKNSLGNDFIIKSKPNLNWTLTQERLKIGDLLCFKAVRHKRITNRLGKKISKKIIAWYHPDIPLKVGLKDYQGLPGIIVRLEDDIFLYELKRIEINSKLNVDIQKPKYGKIISNEEYNEILLKSYKSRF